MEDMNQNELPGFYVGIDLREIAPNLEQKQWMANKIINGVKKVQVLLDATNSREKF